MPDTTEESERAGEGRTLWRRLGWFVLLYAAGLAAVGLLAAALRALVRLAGQ